MCTAISYAASDHYFGRNLDLEYSYQESVTVTPRNYSFSFRFAKAMGSHYAMIGMAYVLEDYPLYYEATNEKGLSIAGLNFPGNAKYYDHQEGRQSIAPFELIPWMLGQFESVQQVREELDRITIVQESFRADLPASPLHWLISDASASITVECMESGMKVYDNPVGILTNNPPFDYHMTRLTDFMGLTSEIAQNRFASGIELKPYCLGMGAIGLPGDLSSSSRFVRTAFVKLNSQPYEKDAENISQFFHMLDAAAQPKGSSKAPHDLYEYTIYSCCCNTTKGVYYYKTYNNNQLTAVDMHAEYLNGNTVISYPLIMEQQIAFQNKQGET